MQAGSADFKGSAAAADPLGGEVLPGGGYDPPGENLGGVKAGVPECSQGLVPLEKIPREK